jgi:hypothetical protein
LELWLPFLSNPYSEASCSRPLFGSSAPRITQLLYADEGINDTTALTHLSDADAVAFSTLQTVDLCIASEKSNTAATLLGGFITCLEKAES